MWQYNYNVEQELYHHGIKGQKWGVRHYQYADGSLTPAGYRRYYGSSRAYEAHAEYKESKKKFKDAKKRYDKTNTWSEDYNKNRQDYIDATNEKNRNKFLSDMEKEKARIESKNIEFKNKSKHRQKLENQYKELGYDDKEAEAAANNRIRTERLLYAAAGMTVAACATYAIVESRKRKIDGIIKSGEALQRIEMRNTNGQLNDVFYVSKGKHDMQRYEGLLVKDRLSKTGQAYKMSLSAAKDIKVASQDRAANVFGDLLKNNPEFRRSIGYNKGLNLTKSQIRKEYELFNKNIVHYNGTNNKAAPMFYEKLKSMGYGAIQDINDMKNSGYAAKNPLIVFDNSNKNITVNSVQEIKKKLTGSDSYTQYLNKLYVKEQYKALAENLVQNFSKSPATYEAIGAMTLTGIVVGNADYSKNENLKKNKST